MADESQEKPKIIVDDDWKSRAQEEKEELARQQSKASGDESDPLNLPPASLLTLVSALATQATAALGRLPDPLEGKLVKRLELAKHHIDMLGVLEEKTRGNLTDEESATISGVLHELRLDFVAGGYHPPPESSDSESSGSESPIITPGKQ